MTTCSSCADPTTLRTGASTVERCGDESTIVELIAPRPFDFDGLEVEGVAEFFATGDIELRGRGGGPCRLIVRMHGGTISSGSIEVELHSSLPARGERASFRRPIASVELENVSVDPDARGDHPTAPGQPFARGAAIAEELGAFVAILVRGTQGETAGDCNAILSADLVLRGRPREVGGGRELVVLPRTELDYSSLAAMATDEAVLVKAFDVQRYRTGFMALRVLDRSIATGALTIRIYSAFPDPDEPEAEFASVETEAELAIEAGTTPELHTARLQPGFGPYLLVRVEATQGGSTDELAAAIELDFVGQE